MTVLPGEPEGARRPPLLLLAAVVVLAALAAWQKTDNFDLYFHLATGREILARHSTLPVDVFSYSVRGAPWPYKDILADLLLYAGFQHLGFPFLFALKLLAGVGLAGALWLAGSGQAAPLLWALGLLLGAVQYRLVERPLLLSLALFPLLLALLERARRRLGSAPTWRLLIAPVLLQWGWLQLHREALIGLVFLGGFACYLFIVGQRRAAGTALLAFLCACGLDFVNLCGAATLTSTLYVTGSALYRDVLMDWRALGPEDLAREFPVAVALALLAGLWLVLRLLWRLLQRWRHGGGAGAPGGAAAPVDLWHLGCWLVLAYQTHKSSRYVPLLASQSALVLVLLLEEGTRWLARRAGPLRGLPVLAGVSALAIVYATCPASTVRGLGLLPDHFPVRALEFAQAHGLHDKVANAMGLGGYVMWHGGFSVLVDGRADMVYSGRQLVDCMLGEQSPDAFRAQRRRDGADWVLAKNEVGQETHPFLSRDPDWALVFWSEPAAIFVRRSAYPELHGSVFRYLDRSALFPSVERAAALGRAQPALLPEIEGEVRRLLTGSPTGALAHTLLILFYHRLGPARDQDRDALLAELQRLHPDHPVLAELPRMLGAR